jgi:FtsH-binding integral membrane protein
MVWDPPPWMTLVIILSYILAFHYLHRKQRARYKYHSIVLFGAVIVALSVATWYSVNPVDILLIWVVWSLNMGLLFSFIAGSLQQALDHRQRSNDADREADEKHDAFA